MPTSNPSSDYHFSSKQLKVLKFPYTNYDEIICDGAIRSGKTAVMIISFILWAMAKFNGNNFIIAGKTVRSCERNVIEMLMGIKYLNQNFEVKYLKTKNILTIRKGNRFNYFYVFGGKDESSYQLVQGLTAAGALFDEVALMPESFVNQAIARCSVEGSKIWFNCNPESPNHWFYKTRILHPSSFNALYLHFTMDDNPSLSEKKKEMYRRSFTGTFFQRYIVGRWVRAEGLIYKIFADDNEKYIVDTIDTSKTRFMKIVVGVDYGGNGSKHAFVCTGITMNYQAVYILEAERIDPTMDAFNLAELYCKFVQKCIDLYVNRDTQFIMSYHDNAEPTLIKECNTHSIQKRLRNKVLNAKKDHINDRIHLEITLFSQGRLFVRRSCKSVIEAFNNAVWNPKELTQDVRLDNGTSDIDTLDALEYTIERDIDNLINAILRR